MQTLRVTLTPQTAFATLLKGDTLFGQLCWAARHVLGEARLDALLQGYTGGTPFLVVSDAFPAGFLPMPKLPRHYWQLADEAQDSTARKMLKKRQWLPIAALGKPLSSWLDHAVGASLLATSNARHREQARSYMVEHSQPHNTINRATSTTGTGEFAPYTVEQTWYRPGQALDVYALLDETRLTAEELDSLLHYVGASGFGRDASTGLGKFTLDALTPTPLEELLATRLGSKAAKSLVIPMGEGLEHNAWLTLAPCAPQGLAWDSTRCYYKPFTRFGRHGDIAAISGQPYKTPLLLADTGAVLTPAQFDDRLFTGAGLGGDGSLSNALPETVHQGYAPVVTIHLPKAGKTA